jgi:hypothetical protein
MLTALGASECFFNHDQAYVCYEDFDTGQWRCSGGFMECDGPSSDEYVRLTPDDTQEYSFIRSSIIPKARALKIVERYLASGELDGLYPLDSMGKPAVGQK